MTDKINQTELIKKLSLAFGPSGCEDRVREIIKEYALGFSNDVRTDRLGNLICRMSFGDMEVPNRKRIMLSAHTDEVGFMIDGICEDGMLSFGCVGGIDSSVLSGRHVTVGNEKKLLSGVICSKAVHHKSGDERKKAPSADKLYIDIGFDSREECQKHISIGDFGTFDSEFAVFGKNKKMLKCKALDDRLSCAAMLCIMEELADKPIKGNVDAYFCFTVREEIGYTGALCAANAINPDLAIVLETTAISDLPSTEEHLRVATLGGGVVVSLADRSTIYKRELAELAMKVAKREKISAQIKKYVSGGNDAGKIQRALGGIDVLALSIPTRYLHSPACVASIEDYEAQRELTRAILCEIGREEI